MSLVIDASIAVKWLLPEVNSQEALELLETGETLLAPELIYAEVANAIWKRVKLRELSPKEAGTLVKLLQNISFDVISTVNLLAPTLQIAASINHNSVYDCLYLIIAEMNDSTLITADEEFYKKISKTSLKNYIELL